MISQNIEVKRGEKIQSIYLDREVSLDIVMPIVENMDSLPLLLMNDGQDYDQLIMGDIIDNHLVQGGRPFLFVGIHCNEERMREYGTSNRPDYAKRGDKATMHKDFVIQELIPFLHDNYELSGQRFFCGFSLGGLSAFDIAWEHPHIFQKIGVFSGSFWWRSKAFKKGYNNAKHRIIHQKVRNGEFHQHLKFWFQCGTMDETSDRNKNGIIDSIDDTLDLIKELEAKGHRLPEDIQYLEYADGEHNFDTWRKLMPIFVTWLFE